MKRADLIFTSILVPIDFVMFMLAGVVSYFLRFQALSDLRPVFYAISFETFFSYTALVALWFTIVFVISGLYEIGFYRIRNEIPKVIMACSAAILTLILVIFFVPDLFASRFIVLAFWALSIGFVVAARLVCRFVRFLLLTSGIGAHKVVLVGDNSHTKKIEEYINGNVGTGYRVVATLSKLDVKGQQTLQEIAKKQIIDELFIIDPTITHEQLETALEIAEVAHVNVRYSADILGSSKLEIATVAGVPMVEVKRTSLDGWGRIIKRLFDIVVSLVFIVITSPIMLVVAIAVRLESKGPAIYKNERVGPKGNFVVYKFRSMYMEYCVWPAADTKRATESKKAEDYEIELAKEKSERNGPIFKILNDHRRTKVGKFIERTSLDELPQLFNILLGNMSLVGPRPHIPVQVAGYETHHHKVFAIKPGLTGLAQISGRSDLDFEDEVRLDTYYIENWSLLMDLAILIKTPWAVLSRRSNV